MGVRLNARKLWNWLENAPVLWAKISVPLLMLVGLAVLVVILWKVPEWQVPTDITDSKSRAELANEFRKTVAQIVGGLVILVGVYATWKRVAAAERTVEVAQEQQITERFTRAIEQLGNDNEAIILGGIYALERIAKDSQKDHWPIMEVLTAYVRSKAPWDPDTQQAKGSISDKNRPSAPVQTILDVLGRRDRSHETPELRLNLSYTDLRGASISGVHLENANLSGAHLEEAILVGSHLRGANLGSAHLQQTLLDGADLRQTWLVGAYIGQAQLRGTNLEGADLSGAEGLTLKQINSATWDSETMLPNYLLQSEDAADSSDESTPET